ncbi:18795_t:CDS:2, partial [Funneliformis geosporum]
TLETASEQSTSEITTSFIMDIDQTPSPKGKEKEDILAKSKFLAKLAGLPRFTTGKQLLDIGHMVNAMAWIIPKTRKNSHTPLPLKQGNDTPNNDKLPTSLVKKPTTNWSDNVPYDTEE